MVERLAIVTGATGGIGRAICMRLSNDGYTLVAHYHRNEASAHALATLVADRGGRCLTLRADLALPEGVDEIVAAVDELLGREPDTLLCALVNNAARLLGPSFECATPAQFDEYFSINTRAPFFLSQQLSRRMHMGGCIVNLSSASAHFSSPGDIVYAMTKACTESLTKNMAEAVAPLGIRVNAVIPGFTDNGHAAFDNADAVHYMSSFAALGGVSDPATVADAVAFLISASASRTTGALLDVSGGSLLGIRGEKAKGLREFL